jgi:hypothetical protein
VNIQTPETPGRFSLRLDVYSPPQSLLQNHVGGGQRGERRRRSVADK